MKSTILVGEVARQLEPLYQHDALPLAWQLIEKLTEISQPELIAQQEVQLSTQQQTLLNTWLQEIVHQHKPIQYILGSVPFLGVEIYVKPPTLIPRPETEWWCALVIEELKKHERRLILDLCTGSGCIALALAKVFPQSVVYATDIHPDALTQAQKNAQYNNLLNIQFIRSDLYAQVSHVTFDLIVANPPYISESEWQQLEPSVTQWEDKSALVAPDYGLGLIKKIIANAPEHLRPGGQLWIEIGAQQGNPVHDLFVQHGFTQVEVLQDLAGYDRVVKGTHEHS